MQFHIKTIVLSSVLILLSIYSKSQTATIDFTNAPPNVVLRADEYAEFYRAGGCLTYRHFGPNPLPLGGYNVRTVGSTWLALAWPMNALNFYASGSSSGYSNSNLSIEYPFKANKTYEIEIHAGLDHQPWLENHTRPSNYTNAVVWVKLDNNPEIVTNAVNKCGTSYTPVERVVNRYSKLIADGNRAINSRVYKVKFSTLESKNALKITYDPAPQDPNLIFDEILRFWFVNITEMPYEEDKPSTRFYENTPKETLGPNTRNNPVYQIPYDFPTPPRDPNTPQRSNIYNLKIPSNLWALSSDGLSYYVFLNDIIPGLNISKVDYLSILGNYGTGPRPSREKINLPGAFENNNYSYDLFNGDIIIKSTNSSKTPPPKDTDYEVAVFIGN